MPLRAPKRIYSSTALEVWFQRLVPEWEAHFAPQELERGRELYRTGEVREVELGADDAIVHARLEEADLYALVEWKEGRPVVRSSTEDARTGRSLAVAGMYEIEELLADEVAPLPPEKKPKVQIALTPGGPLPAPALGAVPALPAAPAAGHPQPPVTLGPPRPARRLILVLCMHEHTLHCDGFWENADRTRTRALKDGETAELTGPEREKLIRLASVARKAGFRFQAAHGYYAMEELGRIPAFLKAELPQWRQYFGVEASPDVDLLQRGVQAVELHARAKGSADGLELSWNLRIGPSVLTHDEMRKLLRRAGAPVFLAGRGLARLDEADAETLQDWQSLLAEAGGKALPRYMVFSLFGRDPRRVEFTPELQAWRDSLSRPKLGDGADGGILRSYQAQGVRWLRHLCDHGCHALLADEMGLGKTLQALALVDGRPVAGKPNLIVCPASVVPVWQAEAARFFPKLRVEVLKSGHDFTTLREPVLWLASYTQLRRHKAALEYADFGYALLDEAHFIKNPEAKVSQACMSIRAAHRIALTGTPLENRHLDLWTLFRFLMPGLLGVRRAFEEALAHDPQGLGEKLRRQIAPFVLRRTKREVAAELPGKVEVELQCPLTDLQRHEYNRLAGQGVASLGEDLTAAVRGRALTILTLLTRLRQVCCDPALLPWMKPELQQSGKLTVLGDKLAEVLANGHKAVIFSQFVSLLKRARELADTRFPETPVYELTGGTADRQRPVAEFQQTSGAALMLVSLRAGGTGITLHAADYVFLLDPWWNPAVEEQAIDRVHRIGQDRTVFVYRMVTAGTVEDRIQRLKAHKKDIFSRVVGELTDVSDLRNYFDSLSDLVALLPEPQDG